MFNKVKKQISSPLLHKMTALCEGSLPTVGFATWQFCGDGPISTPNVQGGQVLYNARTKIEESYFLGTRYFKIYIISI